MKTSVGIIGVSGYAKTIFNSLCNVLDEENAVLTTATVINPDEEKEACLRIRQQGGMIFEDYRRMFEKFRNKLDLCLIPTSIHWHAPMTLEALRSGVNVLVEKPLCGSPEEGREIVEASRSTGKFVAVAYQNMYSEANWDIKRFILSNTLGKIQSIRVTGSWPRKEDYYRRNRWVGKTHCDGKPVFDSPLNNAFAHFVNLALFFSAKELHQTAQVTHADGKLLRIFPIETYDTAAVRLTTSDNVALEFALTHADPLPQAPRMCMTLECGVIDWTLEKEAVARGTHGEEVKRWKLDLGSIDRKNMFHEVIRCARDQCQPLFPADLAISQVNVIQKINESLSIQNELPSSLRLTSPETPWSSVPNLLASLENSFVSRQQIHAY